MDALPYVDSLIREYLLFRGFVSSLEAFSRDLDADPGCGLQADVIADLIFRKLLPSLDCQALVDLLEHLNGVLYSRLDSRYEPLVAAVEADLLRAFLVSAASAGRSDKVAEFFKLYGPQLLSSSSGGGGLAGGDDSSGAADWRDWFVLPYLQQPEREPRFQVYFSAEWLSLLEASFRNFLAGVMRCLPLPAVLRFNTDRRLRLALQQQVSALQSELSRAKQQLADATAALQQQQTRHEQSEQPQQHLLDGQLQHHMLQAHSTQPEQQQQRQQAVQPSALRPSLDGLEARQGAAAAAAVPDAAHAAAPKTASSAFARHSRDPSLDDWQHRQQQQHHLHLRHSRHSSSAASDADGQELQPLHHQPATELHTLHSLHSSSGGGGSSSGARLQPGGSGLFELLPSAAATAGPGVHGASLAAASPVGRLGRQQQQSHSRTASLGGISFDPAVAAAAGQAAASAGDDDEQQEQDSSSRRGSSEGQPGTAPISIVTGGAATAAGSAVHQAGAASSPGGAAASAAVLSSSPVMSWAAGMMAAGSASGMRPRHTAGSTVSSTPSTAQAGSSGVAASSGTRLGGAAGLTPLALLPGPLRWRVDVQHTQHQQSSTSATSAQPAVSCVAFSPSGANVASACADGLLAIWSPPGLVGNAGRHASVVCGAAVACLAWDARADKLMLVGCSGGGGVRAWHADTRRIMADVASEPGWPHVVALAACPSEPAFAVAANSALLPAQLPAAGSSSASTAVALTGRLAVYNGRSFKRSAVLALPDDVGLASLAYSSSGSQLVVGTAAGSVLLFEPGSRSSPLRVWQVAAAVPPGPAAGGVLPVHVAWRAVPSAGAGAASGVVAVPGGVSSACGSFLSMCCGVLCEWGLAGVSSRTPLLAIDVIAAAAAAVEQQASPAGGSLDDAELMLGTDAQQQQQQQQQQHTNTRADSPGVDRQLWVCRYAASPDGSRVAVVAGQASVGVLLLYDLPGRTSSSSSSGGMLAQPQVLLQGDVLAGGGCVSWHPVQPVLVVGCASSSCSLTISLSADTTA